MFVCIYNNTKFRHITNVMSNINPSTTCDPMSTMQSID